MNRARQMMIGGLLISLGVTGLADWRRIHAQQGLIEAQQKLIGQQRTMISNLTSMVQLLATNLVIEGRPKIPKNEL